MNFNLIIFALVIIVISPDIFSIPPCFNYCDMRLCSGVWMLEAGSRVSWVILIFASPRAERGHGVPIYFRILQHFDIITSSFLGNSLAISLN